MIQQWKGSDEQTDCCVFWTHPIRPAEGDKGITSYGSKCRFLSNASLSWLRRVLISEKSCMIRSSPLKSSLPANQRDGNSVRRYPPLSRNVNSELYDMMTSFLGHCLVDRTSIVGRNEAMND